MICTMLVGAWLLLHQQCCVQGDPAPEPRIRTNMIDPLIRRSPLEKNFMRFGRSWPPEQKITDKYHLKDTSHFHLPLFHDDLEVVRNGRSNDPEEYIRLSKSKGNFMRFGRSSESGHSSSEDNVDRVARASDTLSKSNFIRLGKASDDFSRLERAKDNFMRFGRGKDNFMRFGRAKDNFMRFGRGKDSFMRFGRAKDNFMRFGRAKDNFMRFGRAKDNFMRFGRAKDNFMRFGRAKDNFMRFGRAKDNFMRFGRGKDNFMRFGRAKDNFMRFGRGSEDLFGNPFPDSELNISLQGYHLAEKASPQPSRPGADIKELSEDDDIGGFFSEKSTFEDAEEQGSSDTNKGTSDQEFPVYSYGRSPSDNDDFSLFGRSFRENATRPSEWGELEDKLEPKNEDELSVDDLGLQNSESSTKGSSYNCKGLEWMSENPDPQEDVVNHVVKRSVGSELTTIDKMQLEKCKGQKGVIDRHNFLLNYPSFYSGLSSVIVGPELSFLPSFKTKPKRAKAYSKNFIRLG